MPESCSDSHLDRDDLEVVLVLVSDVAGRDEPILAARCREANGAAAILWTEGHAAAFGASREVDPVPDRGRRATTRDGGRVEDLAAWEDDRSVEDEVTGEVGRPGEFAGLGVEGDHVRKAGDGSRDQDEATARERRRHLVGVKGVLSRVVPQHLARARREGGDNSAA